MNNQGRLIDLGFAEAHLPEGTHICQIYSDDGERDKSLLQFLLQGAISKECGACFSENVTQTMLEEYFSQKGVSLSDLLETGALSLNKTSEIYFKDGEFNPDHMLELLTDFYTASQEEGYTAARVIGEMSPKIHEIPGGSRLMEYESRVSLLLQKYPVTAVCQYNAHHFDGATIMDVLKVHPMMVVHGAVIHNPFYIPPEEYLKDIKEGP